MRPALVPPIVVAVLVLSAPLSAQQEAKLSASDAGPHSRYGASSAVSGDTLVIGAPDGQLDNTGAAYVYTRSGSTWTEQAKLMPTVPVPDSLFGESVAISGDTIVVGAPLDTSSGLIAGAVYVFERTGTTGRKRRNSSLSARARTTGTAGRSRSLVTPS